MTEFIRFFVKFDLWPILQWVLVLPFLMLLIAPLFWLLMVAVGLAPMTWAGFFFNWLIVTVMFETYFVYKRIKANWLLFHSLREKELEDGKVHTAPQKLDYNQGFNEKAINDAAYNAVKEINSLVDFLRNANGASEAVGEERLTRAMGAVEIVTTLLSCPCRNLPKV